MFDYIKEHGVYLFISPDGLHIVGTMVSIKDNYCVVNRPLIVLNPEETEESPEDTEEFDFEPLGSILTDQRNHIFNMSTVMSICTPSLDLFNAYCIAVEADDEADSVVVH